MFQYQQRDVSISYEHPLRRYENIPFTCMILYNTDPRQKDCRILNAEIRKEHVLVRVQFTLFTMRHSCMTRVTEDYKSQLWLDVLQPK